MYKLHSYPTDDGVGRQIPQNIPQPIPHQKNPQKVQPQPSPLPTQKDPHKNSQKIPQQIPIESGKIPQKNPPKLHPPSTSKTPDEPIEDEKIYQRPRTWSKAYYLIWCQFLLFLFVFL